jgi:hypothetical protein
MTRIPPARRHSSDRDLSLGVTAQACRHAAEDAGGSVSEYDTVPYRPSNAPLENHHGIPDVWAKNNVPGYVSRAADNPTMVLSEGNHAAANEVYRGWLTEMTGRPVGGKSGRRLDHARSRTSRTRCSQLPGLLRTRRKPIIVRSTSTSTDPDETFA